MKAAQYVAPTAASGLIAWLATGQPSYGVIASIAALLGVGIIWLLGKAIGALAAFLEEQ